MHLRGVWPAILMRVLVHQPLTHVRTRAAIILGGTLPWTQARDLIAFCALWSGKTSTGSLHILPRNRLSRLPVLCFRSLSLTNLCTPFRSLEDQALLVGWGMSPCNSLLIPWTVMPCFLRAVLLSLGTCTAISSNHLVHSSSRRMNWVLESLMVSAHL